MNALRGLCKPIRMVVANCRKGDDVTHELECWVLAEAKGAFELVHTVGKAGDPVLADEYILPDFPESILPRSLSLTKDIYISSRCATRSIH